MYSANLTLLINFAIIEVQKVKEIRTMTDLEKTIELLEKNNIPYRQTKIYGEDNTEGIAIWFSIGHVEFGKCGKLHNVVPY